MAGEKEYKYIIIPLYKVGRSGDDEPTKAFGHAQVSWVTGKPPVIDIYYPASIHSGAGDITIFIFREEHRINLDLNPAPSRTKGLARYTGFLSCVPGEFLNKSTEQWKLKVCPGEGAILLEGNFIFLDVFENYHRNPDEWAPMTLPLQPVQPFANPLPNHLWWSIDP